MTKIAKIDILSSSVAEPQNIYAAPGPGKKLYAVLAPAALDPPKLCGSLLLRLRNTAW
jgi:hypothetical protein